MKTTILNQTTDSETGIEILTVSNDTDARDAIYELFLDEQSVKDSLLEYKKNNPNTLFVEDEDGTETIDKDYLDDFQTSDGNGYIVGNFKIVIK